MRQTSDGEELLEGPGVPGNLLALVVGPMSTENLYSTYALLTRLYPQWTLRDIKQMTHRERLYFRRMGLWRNEVEQDTMQAVAEAERNKVPPLRPYTQPPQTLMPMMPRSTR